MAKPKAVTLNTNTARLGFGTLAVARISLGLIFLWAFFDKLLGLGFATCRNPETGIVSNGCAQAWIEGGSPTTGFLTHAVKGPFADFFAGLSGMAWVDWLFMLGLLGIGVSLVLGVAVRLGALFGSILMGMMWLAMLWPENHPFIDDHIVYIILLVVIALFARYLPWSVNAWRKLPIVRKSPWLV